MRSPIIKLKTGFQMVFSPTEDRLAFFGSRNVSVINLPSSDRVFFAHVISHPSQIDFSPDGARLVVKSTTGRTIILDASNAKLLSDFNNQKEGEGGRALFSSCGRYVVSVSWSGLFSVRDSAGSELVFSELLEDCMLSRLVTPKDRSFFVYTVGGYPPSDTEPPPPDKIVLRSWPIWENAVVELPIQRSFISHLQISPSGRFLGIIHQQTKVTLEIYDLKHLKTVAVHNIDTGGSGNFMSWSPDEQFVVVTGKDKFLILEAPQLSLKYEIPASYPCYTEFSPSGRYLALGSWDSGLVVPVDHLADFVKSREKLTIERPSFSSQKLGVRKR